MEVVLGEEDHHIRERIWRGGALKLQERRSSEEEEKGNEFRAQCRYIEKENDKGPRGPLQFQNIYWGLFGLGPSTVVFHVSSSEKLNFS